MKQHLTPGSIVVGVDGSDDSDRAVAWAAEQAGLERRHLVVVTAVRVNDAYPVAASGIGPAYAYQGDELLELGRTTATAAADLALRLRPGIEVSTQASLGDPRQILVEASAKAHLVVVGSRGRGSFRSKLLGSVSAVVSRQAECPVVICRPDRGHGAHDGGIVVGADGTAESVPVVEFAFRQASLHDQTLTVLHCVWDAVAAVHGPIMTPASDAGLEEQRMLLAQTVAGLRQKFPEVTVNLQLARGLAEECLAADSPRWGLIVVGRHRVDTIKRLVIGSIATSVVEHAHTTVAVVPEAAPS